MHIATISVGIAFRDQLLAVHKNDQALESDHSDSADPRLQAVYRDVVPSGASSKSFLLALDGWKRQLADMNTALASSDSARWRRADAGRPRLSSVHVPLRAPAHDRGLVALPSLGVLVRSLKQTAGYRNGIAAWLNPKYLELMKERGQATKASIRGLSEPPLQGNVAA